MATIRTYDENARMIISKELKIAGIGNAVRELLNNATDAGVTTIIVFFGNYGRGYIEV